MAFASELITLKQLQEFHNIDRMAYSRLVINLGFHPSLSMKIVAFWNVLEKSGFKYIVYKLLYVSDAFLFSLAKEALMCLECLYFSGPDIFPWKDMDLSAMAREVVGRQDISLGHLFKNKESAKRMIEKFVKNVCEKAFSDIVPLPTNLASKQSSNSNHELQYQTSFGEDNGEILKKDKMATMTEDNTGVDKRDRTLFMTFSKGTPVSMEELHGFLVKIFGQCVEAIYMDKNPKPSYACVVLWLLSDVSRILWDQKIVKLSINGKQLKATRYRDRPKICEACSSLNEGAARNNRLS